MFAHAIAQDFPVDRLSLQRRFGGFYYRAHLLHGIRRRFSNRFADGCVHFSLGRPSRQIDRKSTRLNSSHVSISYAVFCLKKKKKITIKKKNKQKIANIKYTKKTEKIK